MADIKVRIADPAVYEQAVDEVRRLMQSWCARHPDLEDFNLLMTAMLHGMAGRFALALGGDAELATKLRDEMLLAAVKVQKERECHGK
jgi:hypothetical protein